MGIENNFTDPTSKPNQELKLAPVSEVDKICQEMFPRWVAIIDKLGYLKHRRQFKDIVYWERKLIENYPLTNNFVRINLTSRLTRVIFPNKQVETITLQIDQAPTILLMQKSNGFFSVTLKKQREMEKRGKA